MPIHDSSGFHRDGDARDHEYDSIRRRRGHLIRPPSHISKHPPKRRLGNQPHPIFIRDDNDLRFDVYRCLNKLGHGLFRAFFIPGIGFTVRRISGFQQMIDRKKCQTIDEDNTAGRFAPERFRNIQRFFNRYPIFRPVRNRTIPRPV